MNTDDVLVSRELYQEVVDANSVLHTQIAILTRLLGRYKVILTFNYDFSICPKQCDRADEFNPTVSSELICAECFKQLSFASAESIIHGLGRPR